MGKCDITGGILSAGLNKLAETQGLRPIPAGAGLAYDLSPGFVVKQEIRKLCKPETGSLLRLDLDQLSRFTQAYLMDRMESIASEQQDKALKIPGTRLESPTFPLGVVGLPGTGTAVIWYDKDAEGKTKLNGVLLKLTFTFK
ncbi:hypothetical protein [Paludisphaera mucosa]|uniref:Uncharacterized protein n=1 Tax=Paludisphaera mucosa TaxID=3030827 RepID=A0ABT6FHF5_9BACT|nr:hypothetical protein [Paludisphaera mucosa]MDG3007012.1 hypothetical protein [Paludisphaera mucosa]